MSESYVYLLWTSPDWCPDGCHDRLRGGFLCKACADVAVAKLDTDEPHATHSLQPMRLGTVRPDEP